VASIFGEADDASFVYGSLPVMDGALEGDHFHVVGIDGDMRANLNLTRSGDRWEGLIGVGFYPGCNVGYDVVATRIP
jgi:hypothetical protein